MNIFRKTESGRTFEVFFTQTSWVLASYFLAVGNSNSGVNTELTVSEWTMFGLLQMVAMAYFMVAMNLHKKTYRPYVWGIVQSLIILFCAAVEATSQAPRHMWLIAVIWPYIIALFFATAVIINPWKFTFSKKDGRTKELKAVRASLNIDRFLLSMPNLAGIIVGVPVEIFREYKVKNSRRFGT